MRLDVLELRLKVLCKICEFRFRMCEASQDKEFF